MLKNIKRNAIFILLTGFFICFMVGIFMLDKEKTYAEIEIPQAVNLEDLIDSTDDIIYGTARTSNAMPDYRQTLYSSTTKKGELNTVNTANNASGKYIDLNGEEGEGYDISWGIYTKKSDIDGEGKKDSMNLDVIDIRKNPDLLIKEDVVVNANDYDGNLSFFSTDTSETVLWFDNQKTDKNTLISFNMNYDMKYADAGERDPKFMIFSARNNTKTAGIYDYNFAESNYAYKIYMDYINLGISFRKGKTVLTDTKGNSLEWSYQALLDEYNDKNPAVVLENLLNDGDILNVTYGVYDVDKNGSVVESGSSTAVANTVIYLKLYNVTGGYCAVEKKAVVAADGLVRNDSFMGLMLSGPDIVQSKFYNRDAVSIGGVNQPLFANLDFENAIRLDKVYRAGTSASSIVLPTGLTAYDTDTVLVSGANILKGFYEYEYYGEKNVAVDIIIYASNYAEDIIDGVSDITFSVYSKKTSSDQLNVMNTENVTWAGKQFDLKWGMFTDLKNPDENTEVRYPWTLNAGYDKDGYTFADTEKTIVKETLPNSENIRQNDISFFTNEKEFAGVWFNNINDENALVSFKMNYIEGRRLQLLSRMDSIIGNMNVNVDTTNFNIYWGYSENVLTVTYGTYNANESSYFYLNVINDTLGGITVVDKVFDITEQEKTLTRDGNYMGVVFKLNDGGYYLGARDAFMLGGIEDALLNESTTRYNVTVEDMNGKTLSTAVVEQDGEYTFAKAEGREKKFIAFLSKDGKLYNIGQSVTVNSDMRFTLLELGFNMQNGAALRLAANQTGYAGLKYCMSINKADYEKVKQYISVKTLIIPEDLITEDFNFDEFKDKTISAGEEKFVLSDDGENYLLYFTITNIRHYNYNRVFNGIGFIEVQYEDNTVVYIQDSITVSRSVYEVAVKAYKDKPNPDLGVEELKIIEQYINGVIDLEYTLNNDELTIAVSGDREGIGLDKNYSLTENSERIFNKQNDGTYEININIDLSNYFGHLINDTIDGKVVLAPIIIRNSSTSEGYITVCGVTREYNEDNKTLSLDFRIVL